MSTLVLSRTAVSRAGDACAETLTTRLAASAATGQPVRLTAFRAEAARPGLLRPHLAVVWAAASVCGADVEGDAVGSTELVFRPGAVRAGEFRVAVGAGGNAVRVVQAMLPALLTASSPSRIVADGATHTEASLGADALEMSVTPVLCRMGAEVTVATERLGFAPVGGGRVVVDVRPGILAMVNLEARGAIVAQRVRSVVAGLPVRTARRQLAAAASVLDWERSAFAIERAEAMSPGTVLRAEIESEHGALVVQSLGVVGRPPSEVAARLVRDVRAVLASDAPLTPDAAAALVVPVALAGGGVLRATATSTRLGAAVDAVGEIVSARVVREPSGAARVLVG